jgi:dsRNA-specific ribonuclease
MSTQVLSQPPWVNNIKLLQGKVFSIIGRIIDTTHIDALLDETALTTYWAPAFTHKSVDAKPDKNYEKLEFFGDKVMNYVFSMHIRERFGGEIDQAKGTLLMNQYMSKEFQAQLAEKLGLPEYVRFDPKYPNVNIHIKEDVIEAFFGCLSALSDDRIQKGFGTIYCFNLINDIFNDIPIVLEDIRKDPVTRLKELFEKLAWGTPQYTTKNSDNPKLGEVKVEIRYAQTGQVLGVGYGTKTKAEAEAATNSLKTLEDEGITVEYADQEKLERQRQRNPEFERQYRRVQAAIEKLNEVARNSGRVTISDFKITQVETHRVQGGQRYTFAIQVAWKGSDGKLVWKIITQQTGDDQDRTKIRVMKEFADKYNIPEEITGMST